MHFLAFALLSVCCMFAGWHTGPSFAEAAADAVEQDPLPVSGWNTLEYENHATFAMTATILALVLYLSCCQSVHTVKVVSGA